MRVKWFHKQKYIVKWFQKQTKSHAKINTNAPFSEELLNPFPYFSSDSFDRS